MAHTNVRNTGVWVPKGLGGVFRYPLGTPLPTDPWSPRPVVPGWDPRLGGCDDTGVTWTTKRDTDKKKDWNGDKVRGVQTGKDDTWKLKYIEPKNPRVMEEYFGKANVTVTEATTQHGTLITAVSNSDVLPHFSYIVDVFDGAVRKRRCIPDAQVAENGDEIWQSKDWTALEFTYDMFPDLAGNTFYDYTELDDKLIEATYLVTLAGTPTAGSFDFVVAGQPAEIAYNTTAAAFQTAVSALPNVKAATVTGSAGGPFTVKVTTAGVAPVSVDDTDLTGGTVSVSTAP
ncbi:Phage associated (putative structural protein) [Mycobacteroides abscessus subsp. massiliense]|uniref:phage tail tube protein n=1 Tax=Mycobacteroides abscessus TaxID=36809 RepID=UPI00044D46FC|nr:hypothetical protein [Mycobacteroides abscessus]EUA81840.1 hypothetical protein I544_3152 [Mycobacteroides abscessus subsp. bolletii 103]MBN7394899.1 hypothetical protein [Mycobacteroides abscessus subsp. abscessus]MDO3232008.1 hypothetical protein [Mycobacteroides abscessus subsp. abscessus]SIJ94140.1 Phage associated (putative structural protein) [Mycobacteroides abscessus subsp. abscessus]SIK45980.1 Phage associated (putative structural protein) [Mycobacteroides abscessus subsp. abscessu